ncbi:MAG: hypothetical protein MPN21_14540 [Thermoanaerobaculia bacterium]|nr:hypothetical protein [Thermoanaerobaculia bacterium]
MAIKKVMSCVVALSLVLTAGVLLANEQNQLGVEWDAEAVSKMTRDERLAYQRQYKAALEEAARQAGAIPAPSADRVEPVRSKGGMDKVPGTMITYHSGALSPSAVSSFSVGNHFDTALTTMGGLGAVEMSGSITMATIDMASVSGNVFFSVFDQVSGTMANVITSVSTGPLAVGSNTVTFGTPINYVGSSFLAGVWNFGADVVNVATGTVGGQGFHGMSINDIAGTAFATYTMTNAAVGVGGNVATPVELMSFDIE